MNFAVVWNDLITLAETSAVTQGVITTIALLGSIVLQLKSGTVPEWLINIDLIVVGFFFGGKVGVAQGRLQAEQAQTRNAMAAVNSIAGSAK